MNGVTFHERGRASPDRRQIGPIGAGSRVAGGLAAIVLPIALSGLTWWDIGVALVALPLTAAVAAAATDPKPWIRSSVVLVVVVAVEVALTFATPLDGATAISIFLGVSLLVAAVRGDAGCEAVAIPNTLAGRRDPIGCVIYAPVEANRGRR